MILLENDCTASKTKKNDTRGEKVYEIFKLYTILNYIFMFFIIITTAKMYINAKEFQLHMYKLNHDIVQLTRQYDELNRNMSYNINCKFPYETYFYDFINTIKSFDHELSNLLEIYRRDNNNMMSSVRLENNSIVDLNKIQYFLHNLSALQTSEIQNIMTTKTERIDVDILNSQKQPRVRRLQGNIRRSKKEQRNKRKFNRGLKQMEDSQKRSSPLIVTFIGSIREKLINGSSVMIGPWKIQKLKNPFAFEDFYMDYEQMKIEVTLNGLYMITTQIFYYGASSTFSYNVLIYPKGLDNSRVLTKCFAATSSTSYEMMCRTSIIAYIKDGDKIGIESTGEAKFINLKPGFSYIQLLLLAENE